MGSRVTLFSYLLPFPVTHLSLVLVLISFSPTLILVAAASRGRSTPDWRVAAVEEGAHQLGTTSGVVLLDEPTCGALSPSVASTCTPQPQIELLSRRESRPWAREGPIRRPERGSEWELIKILLERDDFPNKMNSIGYPKSHAPHTNFRLPKLRSHWSVTGLRNKHYQ
jgi:hypothetical protein